MESYRYQVKSQADYEKFIGWLVDHKCNFTTQHNYVPSAGDHIYHVTVSAEDENADIFGAIGDFLDNETDLVKVANMNSLYESADDAFNDPYADAGSLRTMLGSTLDYLNDEKQLHDSNLEDVRKQLEDVKRNRDYYQDNYYKEITKGGRVKEQIRAIALLMDSIFPKD